GGFVLLSGGLSALVVAGFAGREFPTYHDAVERAVSVRHRGQLPAPGSDRKRACAERSAVVWRDGWILGWHYSGELDGQRARLDAVPLDVRIQRQDPDGRDMEAGDGRERQV